METCTVNSRGKICVPKEIRERFGLKKGTTVLFIYSDGELSLRPIEHSLVPRLRKFIKASKTKPKEKGYPKVKDLRTMSQADLKREFGPK
ncbi:MAG: AbrB/MazE/SpoVT family DNA-binding domain-containing protein [Nanoarchaeota archaeon]|nr:AbrB/MazE/SpoVT family DNA-binding domain-containing protein [Nanoarchaeota archaeon]